MSGCDQIFFCLNMTIRNVKEMVDLIIRQAELQKNEISILEQEYASLHKTLQTLLSSDQQDIQETVL